MNAHDTGTLILEGLEQGGREVAEALQIVQTTFIGLAVAFVAVGLFSLWLICRNDARRRKAERDRKRVRTYLEIDGQPVEFEVTNLREAA